MAIQLADVGAIQQLIAFFNPASLPANKDLTLRLFVNNVTPADTDTAATYTEAAGGGYAAKTLSAGSWTISNVGGIAQALYAIQTWTFTGALTTNPTIYGWYLTDSSGTPILVCAEKLGTGFTPANNGDNYAVTPKFQLSKGTPT